MNYVQPSTPQHDSSSPTHNRAHNYFSPLSQENAQQTTTTKSNDTHQHQQWTTLQAPSLNLTNVTWTMRSPSIIASGGSLQPMPHSTTSKTSKSQRTTLHLNYPLPLYPEETTQTSAPSSPTSPKQGAPSNTGSNKPNLKTSRKTQWTLTNGSAPAQLYSKKNENVNNSWPIPAFFQWYCNYILTSSDKFLNLILQINNIPFTIRTNTVNSWFSKIREWSIEATAKFIIVQAPFPKCDVLHAFLYNANLWDPTGKDEYKECLTNKLRIIFSNSQELQNTNF